MKSKKRVIAIIATLTLVFSLGIGVSAAAGAFSGKTRVSKGLILYNDNSVVVDGDSVGYWLADSNSGLGTWSNGNSTTWSAGATLTITDEDLTPNSFVDVYFEENCKDVVSKADIKYIQADKTLKVVFSKASKAGNTVPVKIEAIHVVNPKAAP